MFGQCQQQALIWAMKSAKVKHTKTPSVLSILTMSGQIKIGRQQGVCLGPAFGFFVYASIAANLTHEAVFWMRIAIKLLLALLKKVWILFVTVTEYDPLALIVLPY